MAATISAPAKCDMRNVISFLQVEGSSGFESHHRKSKINDENFMKYLSVQEWYRKIKEVWIDVGDERRLRCKSAATVGFVSILTEWTVFGVHSVAGINRKITMKLSLGGWQVFAANNEFLDEFKTYLSSLVANFFELGFKKDVSGYNKCLNRYGDHVEKQVWRFCTFSNKVILVYVNLTSL